MKILKTVISANAPMMKDALWLKPVTEGFLAYILNGGTWVPLKLAEDQGTATEGDDVVRDLIGSVQDTATSNTINGAKAYAADAVAEVVGEATDTSADLTLNGLKAYVDEQIAALG